MVVPFLHWNFRLERLPAVVKEVFPSWQIVELAGWVAMVNLRLYMPPVFSTPLVLYPLQTTMSVPVHTATCSRLAPGAPVVDVASQLSDVGL